MMIFQDLAPNQIFIFNTLQKLNKALVSALYITKCEGFCCINNEEKENLPISSRYFIKIHNQISNYDTTKCYYCGITYETDDDLFVIPVKTIII